MASPWTAIVNPRAGRARSARARARLATDLRRELGAEVVFTEYPGHALELARATRSERIAVFGGDGTAADVVNGMDLDNQRLLVVPGGTGNGLARDLGLRSVAGALAAGRRGRTRTIDLVRVAFAADGLPHRRLVISTASAGYAAGVVILGERLRRYLHSTRYLVAALVHAFQQVPFAAVVALDGGPQVRRELTNLLVNNTAHSGNFPVHKGADPADGLFEVLLARATAWEQVRHDLSLITRTYAYAPAPAVPVRTLSVRLDEPRVLMVDGELFPGVLEAEFEVVPGVLRCFA